MKLRTIIFSRQTLIILIAGLVSLAAIYYTLVSSAGERRDSAEELLASRQAVVQELEVKLAQARAGTSEAEQHLQLVQKVDAILPPDISQVNATQGLSSSAFLFVFRTLPTLHQRYGLEGNPAGLSDLTAGPPGLEYLEAAFSFTGSAQQIAAFVDGVRSYPILATVENLSLRRASDSAVDSWDATAVVRVWFSTLAPLPGYTDPGYNESMLGGTPPPPTTTDPEGDTGDTATPTVPSDDLTAPEPPTPDPTMPGTTDSTVPATTDTTVPTTDTTLPEIPAPPSSTDDNTAPDTTAPSGTNPDA